MIRAFVDRSTGSLSCLVVNLAPLVHEQRHHRREQANNGKTDGEPFDHVTRSIVAYSLDLN